MVTQQPTAPRINVVRSNNYYGSSASSMTSSMCSSVSQSTQNTNKPRKPNDNNSDADISRLSIRISHFALVLLNCDVLIECSVSAEESPLDRGSVEKLKQMSDNFFNIVQPLKVGFSLQNIENAHQLLDTACKTDYLRVLAAPIVIEGEEQRKMSGNIVKMSASIARVNVREVCNGICVQLLDFVKEELENGLPPLTEITFNYSQNSETKLNTIPKAEIE